MTGQCSPCSSGTTFTHLNIVRITERHDSYENLAAVNEHAAIPEVNALRAFLQTGGLSEPPSVIRTTPFGASFVRPGSSTASDSGLTIMIKMTWGEGTDMSVVKANFSELIEYGNNEEPQTLAYHYSTSPEHPNTLFAFEQFESGEFCMGTHMKSEVFGKATKYQIENMKPEPVFAKRVLGFATKE